MICCWVSFAPCSHINQVCCFKLYRISMHVCNYRHPQDSMRTQEEIYQTCNCCLYAYLLKPVVLLWCNILATNNFNSGSVLCQSDQENYWHLYPLLFLLYVEFKKKITCLWKYIIKDRIATKQSCIPKTTMILYIVYIIHVYMLLGFTLHCSQKVEFYPQS